ncbi:MAG: hypothetical protein ACKOQ1_10400, partial [Actinomycetota bacterium]
SATVLDGGSTDATASIARDAGIGVLAVSALMPHLGPVLGKGDSLFRGVHSVEADWYVFLDADIGNIGLRHDPGIDRLAGDTRGAGHRRGLVHRGNQECNVQRKA